MNQDRKAGANKARALLLAVALPLLAAGLGSCARTKYICPAYQSAFQLDMLAYKRNRQLDTLNMMADTSQYIDVIATLAERIRISDQITAAEDADSQPKFPEDNVVKTEYLLIRKTSRKRKNKMLATVPMITMFPQSVPDSTQETTNLAPREKMDEQGTPKLDEGQSTPDGPQSPVLDNQNEPAEVPTDAPSEAPNEGEPAETPTEAPADTQEAAPTPDRTIPEDQAPPAQPKDEKSSSEPFRR